MKNLFLILNFAIMIFVAQNLMYSQIEVTYQATNPTCYGYQDGQIDISTTGTTGPLSFMWSTGDTTEDLNYLSAGDYYLTVTSNSAPEAQVFDWEYPLAYAWHMIDFLSSAIEVPGYTPDCNDYIGVFYQSNTGGLECGGYVPVCYCITIYPAGSYMNPVGVGFQEGDEFIWKLFITSENIEIDLTPTYSANSWYEYYHDFGLTYVSSLTGVIPEYEPVTEETITQITLTEPDLLVSTAGDCQSRFIGFEPLYTGNYLEASASGGVSPYTYTWDGPNFTTNSNQQDVIVTPLVPTTYSLTVTDANLCTSTSDVFIDVIDVKADCKGSKKVLVCHVPPGNPPNAHEICISINAVCTHLNNHGGDQIGPCNNPCLTDLDPNKSSYPESYDEIVEDNFNVYPNPSYGDFVVNFMVEYDEEITINLVDITGKTLEVVFNDKAIGNYKYELALSKDLLPGIYSLQFINKGQIENKKIMIVD